MDKFTNSENLLAYDLISDDLRFVMNSEILGFEITNDNLKFTNKSGLGFELKSYHPEMPIYAVILDFMFETGGIW